MTDVVRGDFAFDYGTGTVKGLSSPNRQYLDPEISGEGTKVILSNGSEVRWSPPPSKPVIPDWSEYKSIRHYFNRVDHQFFPCWLYHPTEAPVIVKSAQEAGEKYGVELLERTDAERAEYGGGKYRWKFNTQWRTTPHNIVKAQIEASGKNLEIRKPDATEMLMRALQGFKSNAAPPPDVDPVLLEEFRAFQNWKAQRANADVAPEYRPSEEISSGSIADAEIENSSDKEEWLAKAREAEVKVDPRWTMERVRHHVMRELRKRAEERQMMQRESQGNAPASK